MVSGVETDKGKIIQAIIEKDGIIERAAKRAGVTPKTIYAWMNRDEEVAEAVREAREANRLKRLDDDEDIAIEAYNSIKDLLRGRDVTATLFALKCKQKWSDKAGDLLSAGYAKTEVVDYSKAVDG